MYTYHSESATYGNDRHFSEAIADAAWRVYLVDGDLASLSPHLAAMTTIFDQWQDHYDASKSLYYIEPLLDATEYTISSIDASGGQDGFTGGDAFRPSINSFQYANARAIANLALATGNDAATAATYTARAEALQRNFTTSLWNATFQHFVDRYYVNNTYVTYWDFIRGRELVGLTPWAWDVVPDEPAYAQAWAHALDTAALRTPAGLSTVEPSYEYYMRQYRYDAASGKKECQWNGPIWPFQTTAVLNGLSNLLDHYNQSVITTSDYVTLLRLYAELHYNDGVLNLVEDYYPNNGSALVQLARSPHYFHSGFIDLILGGLVGIRPRSDDFLEINPLVDASVSWFQIDNVLYHGHNVSVQWDEDGSHFGEQGLVVAVDGLQVNSSSTLTRLVSAIGVATPNVIESPLAKSVQLQSSSTYPVGNVSVVGADVEQIHDAIDGRVWFWTDIVNGYDSAVGDGTTSQWFSVDFGAQTSIGRAELAFYQGSQPGTYTYADGTFAAVNGTFAVPVSYFVQYQSSSGVWTNVTTSVEDAALANGITNVAWTAVTTNLVRLVFTPASGTQVRLVEFKVF